MIYDLSQGCNIVRVELLEKHRRRNKHGVNHKFVVYLAVLRPVSWHQNSFTPTPPVGTNINNKNDSFSGNINK